MFLDYFIVHVAKKGMVSQLPWIRAGFQHLKLITNKQIIIECVESVFNILDNFFYKIIKLFLVLGMGSFL